MKSFSKIGAGSGIILMLSALHTAAQEKQKGLDEVMVTVQKRVQSAQSVPVAVTAFSKDRLNELGVVDIFDLEASAPSFQVSNTQSSSTTSFSIRGVGTSGQNYGLESSVGLYVDGVYRARQSSVINDLIDIEAIEILRGPQGSLFGRNTPSGALHIKTIKPSHEDNGYVGISAGNYGLFSASGAVGGSLVEDVWAYRATAFTSQRDGFVSDISLGDDKLNDRDRHGARVQLLYTPSDTFSARLIADYSEIDETCCAGVTVRNNTFSSVGQPGSDLLLSAFGGTVISQERVFDDVTALNTLPVSQNEDSGVSLELRWGQENDAQLTSITSFRNFDQFTDLDADFSNIDIFTISEKSESSSFSQEVRFAKDTTLFDYVIGAYYFDQTIDSGAQFTMGQFAGPYVSQDALISQLVGAATLFGVPVADALPAGSGSRDSFTQDQKSAAAFGQLDYYVTDALTLTAGMRYTKEDKKVVGLFAQDNTGPNVDLNAIAAGDPRSIVGLAFPGWGYTLGGPLTVIGARDNVQESLDDSQLTGTLKLAYNPSKQTLIYASYGTGYKSGGTNTDRIGPQFDTVFDAETSKALEFGIKKDFPLQALRVNLSLHNTVTEDFQTVAFTGTGFSLVNAGEVETRGGELELIWYPSDSMSIRGAIAINDGEYKSFPGSPCWVASPFQTGQLDPTAVNGVCDRTGDPIAFNPEEVFMLAIDKQFVLAERYGYLHMDYSYRAEAFEDTDLDPLKEQDGYGLLNLKAGMYFGNGKTEVAVWMKNAFDEDYLRTYFDVPLQTGKLNSYAQEPRTYGVSIQRQF